ncbi:MAG: hypothetical protein LQ339_005191 [Xanthoria mediterranea]|nr:MAG: hypothetical protein LQ339_005191 [Xanthoria mediterranea]
MLETQGDQWDGDLACHNSFLSPVGTKVNGTHNVHVEEAKTAPLFSVDVARRVESAPGAVFPQYGLLAKNLAICDPKAQTDWLTGAPVTTDKRIFLNVNAPFSAFICGSQGSGKSHTLSCMLEASLMESRLGKLPRPLTGIVFHWDKHTAVARHQPCEAAYLCSCEIPVTVLVSPSNFWAMKEAYENLPGLDRGARRPVVRPLLFRQKHLNVDRMMTLMSIDTENGHVALYTEVIHRILRQMAMSGVEASGLDYPKFRAELKAQNLFSSQNTSLEMRFQLLESFIDGLSETYGVKCFEERMPEKLNPQKWTKEQIKKRKEQPDMWTPEPGSLTIVDLSDPFVNENSACALFDICLSLFLENHRAGGTILALDEAHKFLSGSDYSLAFTESLVSVIRLQRHYGARIIIATQEPTISPKLLDLCSMTIVHRFNSPSWMATLKGHLAGVSYQGNGSSERNTDEIFNTIVSLDAGQALIFSPSAMLDVSELTMNSSNEVATVKKLGLGYVKIRVRQRLTTDGGRSLMAASAA